jgi:hypothetical protein
VSVIRQNKREIVLVGSIYRAKNNEDVSSRVQRVRSLAKREKKRERGKNRDTHNYLYCYYQKERKKQKGEEKTQSLALRKYLRK